MPFAKPHEGFSLLKKFSSLDKMVVLNKAGKRISLPAKFSIDRYHPNHMREMKAWDWAFQFAIRRSCWKAVESLTAYKQRAKDTRNFQQRRDDINRLYRTDKAIEMFLSNPIVSRDSLAKFGLEERNFWHISYLLDNTVSVSPAISIPTLGELEELAGRARYIASTEPNRLTVGDHDPDSGEWIDGSFPALDPDYVGADTFLDGAPLILCVKTGNRLASLKKEFDLFIDDYFLRRSQQGLDQNDLNIVDLSDLYLLAYIDLKIWTKYQRIDFYQPADMAWIIGDSNITNATVSRRIAILADLLLDNDSRPSQELLRQAAIQRTAQKPATTKPKKRGRRPRETKYYRFRHYMNSGSIGPRTFQFSRSGRTIVVFRFT